MASPASGDASAVQAAQTAEDGSEVKSKEAGGLRNEVRGGQGGAPPHWWAGTVSRASSDIRDTSTFCSMRGEANTHTHKNKAG